MFLSTNSSGGGNVLCIPLSLFLAIMLTGKVSGGHCNPAVSLAFLVGGWNEMSMCQKMVKFCLYVMSQLVGGTLAIGISKLCMRDSDKLPELTL